MATPDDSVHRSIPKVVARRLPLYLAHVRELAAQGREKVSSDELAQRLDRTPALVRRDLSALGRLGTAGLGYSVHLLIGRLTNAMALGATHALAVVGTDEAALTIANCARLRQEGFEIAGVFHLGEEGVIDIDGLASQPINELADAVESKGVEIAAVSAPQDIAGEVLRRVADAGVRAIVNVGPSVPVAPHGEMIVYDLDPLLALRRALAELATS